MPTELSWELFLELLTSVLAVLGALALIIQLFEKSSRPRFWWKFDSKKRAFLLMVFSVIVGSAGGLKLRSNRLEKNQKKRDMEELEFKIIQLVSLLRSGMHTGQFPISKETFKTIKGYAEEYAAGVEELIPNISSYLSKKEKTKYNRIWNNEVLKLK